MWSEKTALLRFAVTFEWPNSDMACANVFVAIDGDRVSIALSSIEAKPCSMATPNSF